MTKTALYDDLQRANRRSTRVLLAGSFIVVAALVWTIAGLMFGPVVLDPALGTIITVVGVTLGVGLTYTSYRSGPKIALRAAKAREVSRHEAPELHNLLDEVCVNAGLAGNKPKLYIVDDPAPNAFATGLSIEDSHVAVTTGLVENLKRYELRAVLAHEVAHIMNDDIRAVTVAVATAGVVAILADFAARFLLYGGGRRNNNSGGGNPIFLVLAIVGIILAPLAAQLIRFAVSRQREYLADATAAEMLRDPQSMVNALRRIDSIPHTLKKSEMATAHLWFDEPNETGKKGVSQKLASKFATHPAINDRVERLAQLNAGTVRTDAPL